MKQNFTVRQGALDGVEAFLSVAQHRSFRRAAAGAGSDAIGDQPCGIPEQTLDVQQHIRLQTEIKMV
jgi:hypothetical protein